MKIAADGRYMRSALVFIFAGLAFSFGPSLAVAKDGSTAGMTLDVCPNDYSGFGEESPPLTCGCAAEAARHGEVLGANPYYWQSGICRAALHAGVIPASGGQVIVTPDKAPVFPGVTRNGVLSRGWGADRGFRLAGAGTGEPSAGSVKSTTAGMTLDVCPNDYFGFGEESPPLTCGCTAEAARHGEVLGANPYYWQSGICRAALHAGVIPASGGQVIVTPDKAPVFPGITRNGVLSRGWGADKGFHIASVSSQPAKPSTSGADDGSADDSMSRGRRTGGLGDSLVDAFGRPVQAPIAETLRVAGKVQVYVHFVADSAQLQPTSDPVLEELLNTLNDSPALKVDLVGHTDSTGSAAHNQDLSERRAASVYLWLVQHGIARERLRSSGRGFLEPIATNDTDAGRALNRRVEVKSLTSEAETHR